MIAINDLHKTAREYLRAAKLLRTRQSHDVAVYLCGYAVEIALKARICRTLHWTNGFPETRKDFEGKSSLKTHDLEILLDFTGIQNKVKLIHFADWAIVNKWNPEQRYSPLGTQTLTTAKDMIQAAQNLLGILLRMSTQSVRLLRGGFRSRRVLSPQCRVNSFCSFLWSAKKPRASGTCLFLPLG